MISNVIFPLGSLVKSTHNIPVDEASRVSRDGASGKVVQLIKETGDFRVAFNLDGCGNHTITISPANAS